MLQWEKGLYGQLGTAQLEELALTSGATPPPAQGNVHPAAWKSTDKVSLCDHKMTPACDDSTECSVHL